MTERRLVLSLLLQEYSQLDLNLELMREQIALHGIANATSRDRRNLYRDDARAIRDRINLHFKARGAFVPVSA